MHSVSRHSARSATQRGSALGTVLHWYREGTADEDRPTSKTAGWSEHENGAFQLKRRLSGEEENHDGGGKAMLIDILWQRLVTGTQSIRWLDGEGHTAARGCPRCRSAGGLGAQLLSVYLEGDVAEGRGGEDGPAQT